MPIAEWTHEKKPGEPWTYNEPGMAYDQATFDGLAVKYNSLGEATVWDLEDK